MAKDDHSIVVNSQPTPQPESTTTWLCRKMTSGTSYVTSSASNVASRVSKVASSVITTIVQAPAALTATTTFNGKVHPFAHQFIFNSAWLLLMNSLLPDKTLAAIAVLLCVEIKSAGELVYNLHAIKHRQIQKDTPSEQLSLEEPTSDLSKSSPLLTRNEQVKLHEELTLTEFNTGIAKNPENKPVKMT